MRCFLLLPLPLLLAAATSFAQGHAALKDRFDRQEAVAFELYNNKDWPKAIAAFEKQIAIYPGNPRPYYNVACCYALSGDAKLSAVWLRLAVSHGWHDLKHLQGDSDFVKVRDGDEHRAAVAWLVQVRADLPAVLPHPHAARDAAAAQSVQEILAALVVQQRKLDAEVGLLSDYEIRKRLFGVQDEALGRLTRYLIENGDARDAGLAAYSRVQLAMSYLARAQSYEKPLRLFAAELVRSTSSEYLRGWAGSPFLADVLLWRSLALAEQKDADGSVALWKTLVADHPGTTGASVARARLIKKSGG